MNVFVYTIWFHFFVSFQEVKKEKAPVTASKKPGGGHVSNLAKNLGHGGIKMGPPPAKLKGKYT